MTVTAIIPLYNKAKTIVEAITSIQQQTLPPEAILVVDDGSTDGGDALVEALNIPNLILVRQTNAGPGAARNTGLRMAQTPFVAFLDADDVWLPHHVQTLAALTKAHPGMRIYANRLGDWTADRPALPPEPLRVDVITNYPAAWAQGLVLWTCAIMVSRADALSVGGFPTSSNRGEDLALWLKLTCGPELDEQHAVAMSDTAGALYRTQASDLTARPTASPDAAMMMIGDVLTRSPSLSPERRQDLINFRARLALLHAADWIRHGGRAESRAFLALASETRSDRALLTQLRLLTGPLWHLRSVVIAMRRLLTRHGSPK
jgi:hypothetical protein